MFSQAVTNAIRDHLKSNNLLTSEERIFKTQINLNLTDAQKSDPVTYEAGQVVQFTQNAKGFKRGSRHTVCGHNEAGQVLAMDKFGTQRTLPLATSNRFAVYVTKELPIAVGDCLRIAQNGFTSDGKRVDNGENVRVSGFTPSGDIVLDNKKRSILTKDFGNIEHGYVTTSHARQGKTVDRVLIAQGTESLLASSAEQFYVSVSRGRESVRVYTDDANSLRRAVGTSAHRMAAVELLPEAKATHERANLLQHLKSHTTTLATRAQETSAFLRTPPRKPLRQRELSREFTR